MKACLISIAILILVCVIGYLSIECAVLQIVNDAQALPAEETKEIATSKGDGCMKEYIDLDNLKSEFTSKQGCITIEDINKMPRADVVGREEYDRLRGDYEHLKGSMTLMGCVLQSEDEARDREYMERCY